MSSLVLYIKQSCASKKLGFAGYGRHFRSVSFLTGGNLLSSVLGAIGGLLVARFIRPEVAGTFRSYTVPLMYLTFLHLGTFDGLRRQIPYYIGKGLQDEASTAASASGAWNAFVAAIVSSTFLMLAAVNLINKDYQAAVGWLTQAVACWCTFYVGYLCTTYRTINHFVALSKISAIQSLTIFLLVFTLPFIGFYGLCLRVAVPSVLILYLYHHFRPLKIPLKFSIQTLKNVVAVGLPLCFWGTLDSSLWMAMENTYLLKLGGVKELGLFSVVFVLREGLSVLTRAVHQVMSPRIIEKLSREGSLRKVTLESMKISLFLVLLTLTSVPAFALVLDYLVPLAIPKYIEGLAGMKFTLWVAVVDAASLPLNALYATGKAWLYGRGVLAGLLTFAIITPFLVPYGGVLLAVVSGSLIGRIVRVGVCYLDLYLLVRREACDH